jgi:hypothetical protein
MKTDKDPECPFIVGRGHRYNKETKQYDPIKYHCMKIAAEDSAYCPHHAAWVEFAGEKPEQKNERVALSGSAMYQQ